MKKAKLLRLAREHRAILARELVDLAQILETEQICPDAGPLRAAANQCRGSGGDHWQYDITNLLIPLPNAVVSLPIGAVGVSCRLNFQAHGLCSRANENFDPMDNLTMTLVFDSSIPTSPHPLIQSWRLERHSGGQSLFAHPRYHFQYGGWQLQQHANSCGFQFFDGLVFLEAPRIAHPPLDGILAVDLVVSNFGAQQWSNLRSDIRYTRLVDRAQVRCWYPYAVAASSRWSKTRTVPPWPAIDIWPQLN